MFDGVKQLSSHAYFTLWVNYHADRLITHSDRGVEEQASSLRFKHKCQCCCSGKSDCGWKCERRETVASVLISSTCMICFVSSPFCVHLCVLVYICTLDTWSMNSAFRTCVSG